MICRHSEACEHQCQLHQTLATWLEEKGLIATPAEDGEGEVKGKRVTLLTAHSVAVHFRRLQSM